MIIRLIEDAVTVNFQAHQANIMIFFRIFVFLKKMKITFNGGVKYIEPQSSVKFGQFEGRKHSVSILYNNPATNFHSSYIILKKKRNK